MLEEEIEEAGRPDVCTRGCSSLDDDADGPDRRAATDGPVLFDRERETVICAAIGFSSS
jgi:hypothetical protein